MLPFITQGFLLTVDREARRATTITRLFRVAIVRHDYYAPQDSGRMLMAAGMLHIGIHLALQSIFLLVMAFLALSLRHFTVDP